jgi:hypothetical protein
LSDDALRQFAPSVFATGAHESRSARYAHIPTVDVLSAMRREGFFPVQAVQSRCRILGKAAFTKHQIRFNHGAMTASAVGDSIAQVVLTNSHDGSSAYRLDLGVFRLICLNGMMVSDGGEFATLKIPHAGNVAARVIEGSYKVIDDSKHIGERIEAFRAVQLSDGEQQAFARSALMLRWDGAEPPVSPVQALRARRTDDQGADLWRTFNRVQESVIRGGLGYRSADNRRRMTTREVKGIDQNSNLNRALWRLAEEMRALKTA